MQSDLLKKTSVPSTVGLPTQEIKEGKIKSELDATSVMQDTTQKEANWKLLNKRKCIHGGKNFDKTGESLPLSHVVREMLQRHVFDEITFSLNSFWAQRDALWRLESELK